MNSHKNRSDKNPRSILTDHLDSSIARVRENLDAVSFWAHAVSGFAQPIPAYEPDEACFQNLPIAAAPKRRAKPGKSRTRH